MAKGADLFSKSETGATNGWNKKDHWRECKCAVLIRYSDFQSVYFTAYLYSEYGCWSIPIRYQIRRLSKLYRKDRNAGRVQSFRTYRQHAHEIPTEERKIEFQHQLLCSNTKSFLCMCSNQEIKSLLQWISCECLDLIQKLNLGIVDEVRYVTQKVMAPSDNETLTGWMTAPQTGRYFVGVRKRRLFAHYLGEPVFQPKKLVGYNWYHGEMVKIIDSFCTLWKNHPSILPIAAYGVLVLMYTPPKPNRQNGRFLLNFSAQQPCALVVTGCRRDSLAALRALADTNFDPKEPRQRESWLDSILQEGNFFEPYAKQGYFQNITLFENNPAEQLEPGLTERWEDIHEYGLHPVVWMPNLKGTCCTRAQMKKILRVQVRKEIGPVFPQKTFRTMALIWREMLRLYILYLEKLENVSFRDCSLRSDSCSEWRKTAALDGEEKAFLQSNPEHQSVAFAFAQLLRWFEKEDFVGHNDAQQLLRLLVRELRVCDQLFNESELDRLHRYFGPIMAEECPTRKKEKPPFVFWNGEERRTKERCLYIEANRWEDHYRKQTKSEASNTQLLYWLKPYLVQRPDKKALGMQRVYRDPTSGKTRKLYVLCIRKVPFLQKQ